MRPKALFIEFEAAFGDGHVSSLGHLLEDLGRVRIAFGEVSAKVM